MLLMKEMKTGAERMFRLEIETSQSERDSLRLLLDITKAITSELELDKLLQLIMDKTRQVLDVDRCSVYLVDENQQELWTIVAHGMEGREIRLPLSKGLAGHVASTGEILNIRDAYRDQRFDRAVDISTGYRTTSVLSLPIKNKTGVIIGVVQVLNKRHGLFNKDDEELLGSVAAVAAIAIENAQLYRRSKNQVFDKVIESLSQSRYETDPVKLHHAQRVARAAQVLAAEMGFNPEQKKNLWYACMLHDVTKVDALRELFIYEGNIPARTFWHIAETISAAKQVLGTLAVHGLARQVHAQPQDSRPAHNTSTLTAQLVAFCDLADAVFTHDTGKGKEEKNPLALLLSETVSKHFDHRIIQHFLCNYADFLRQAA